MNEETFLKYLQHFVKYTLPSPDKPILLLLDNHASHVSLECITFAKANNITLLSFPPHCSHKLQPLDRTVYGPLKAYYNQAADNWMRERDNAGKSMTIHVIPKLVTYAFPKAMTPENICSGFKVTGIYPFDRNVFSPDEFMASYVTDRPLPEDPTNQGDQNAEQGQVADDQPPMEDPHHEMDQQANVRQARLIQQMATPSTSTGPATEAGDIVLPEQVRPFGQLEARKGSGKRKKSKSEIYTDTPVKRRLELEHQAKLSKTKPAKRLNFKRRAGVSDTKSPDRMPPMLKKKNKTAKEHGHGSKSSSEDESDVDEDESDVDERELCDDSSSGAEDDRCVETMPNVADIVIDDHLLVKFVSDRATAIRII